MENEKKLLNAESILLVVQEMRSNQKTFFTTKDIKVKKQALIKSKQLEWQVDKIIEDYFSPQKSLF